MVCLDDGQCGSWRPKKDHSEIVVDLVLSSMRNGGVILVTVIYGSRRIQRLTLLAVIASVADVPVMLIAVVYTKRCTLLRCIAIVEHIHMRVWI